MRTEESNCRWRWSAALLTVLVLAVYGNNLHAAFVLDDVPWILNNENIRSLWPIWKPLINTSRPVVQWSLAVNYALGGLNPVGYHVTNNLLHTLTALVLLGVVRRTLRTHRLAATFGGAADGLGFAVALLWALHPLDTESVTYVIQRSESMAGLFSILTLYCVIRSATGARTISWNCLAAISCLLAVGSKPVAAVIPFAVLAYDRVFLSETWSELWRRRWRLYIGLAVTWVLLAAFLSAGQRDWVGSAGVVSGNRAVAWTDYARLQPGVILRYLSLSLWPNGLCLLSSWPLQPSGLRFLVQSGAIAVLLAATLWLLCRRNAAGFLGAWFFLTLAPTSSVIPLLHPTFEHRMYLPLMAVVAAVVVMAYRVLVKWRVSGGASHRLGFGAVIVAGLGLAATTVQRNADYRTEVSIWQDTARKSPTNPDAQYGLGLALATAGRLDEAGTAFAEVLRLRPDFAPVQYDWGNALLKAGQDGEALAHFTEALHINPRYAQAQDGIGVVLYRQGRLAEAIEHFFEATRLDPRDVQAHQNLARALREQQQQQSSGSK
jgi:tetratricopeptide (TPR) repeat protein